MSWLASWKPPGDDEDDRDRARERLRVQEQRIQALDRAIEVIQRQLPEDTARASR